MKIKNTLYIIEQGKYKCYSSFPSYKYCDEIEYYHLHTNGPCTLHSVQHQMNYQETEAFVFQSLLEMLEFHALMQTVSELHAHLLGQMTS